MVQGRAVAGHSLNIYFGANKSYFIKSNIMADTFSSTEIVFSSERKERSSFSHKRLPQRRSLPETGAFGTAGAAAEAPESSVAQGEVNVVEHVKCEHLPKASRYSNCQKRLKAEGRK